MANIDDPTAEPATALTPVATSPALRLLFSGERIAMRDHPLEASRVELGRAVSGRDDMRLDDDPRVSRLHATFVTRGGRVRMKNHSVHGTYVNGERVDEEESLVDGDVIRVGDTFLVLRYLPDNPRDVLSRTVLGRAPAVMQLRSLIDVVGPTKASVLLLGETGAGKEVAARALHERSGRKGPFVAVNCAAIPENLAESQLFGHKAGAFTGAHKDHAGYFREAHTGTLFLDELGELPLALQPKLLRVLDEKQVFAVGASSGVPVDVRVVAATNRQIARDVETGAFRGDLFARIAEITVSLPPLRARVEDVLLLLQEALPSVRTASVTLSPQLVNALLLHAWPFNVRELMKIATELEVKAQGRALLDVDLLEGRALGPGSAPAASPALAPAAHTLPPASSPAALAKLKKEEVPAPTREELERLLLQCKGKVSDIARATGRSRTQVYRWIEEYGLDIEAYRR
jgi:DNA-binding NtrC family response regulator